MRFTLRPNGDYAQHHIAGVTIPRAGREAIVDDKLEQFLRDDPAGPLRLSPKAYAHFRGEFGKALIAEPIGAPDAESAARRISLLEGELTQCRAQLAAEKARADEGERQVAALKKKLSKPE